MFSVIKPEIENESFKNSVFLNMKSNYCKITVNDQSFIFKVIEKDLNDKIVIPFHFRKFLNTEIENKVLCESIDNLFPLNEINFIVSSRNKKEKLTINVKDFLQTFISNNINLPINNGQKFIDKFNNLIIDIEVEIKPNDFQSFHLSADTKFNYKFSDNITDDKPFKMEIDEKIFEEIGGLNEQLKTIIMLITKTRTLSLSMVDKLQIKHSKGVCLYGPPGTGKTLIARKLAEHLKSKNIKIVKGPELIDKFVGSSEKNIRDLFIDAERDEKDHGNKSPLHVIIIDEVDALCEKRSSSGDVSSNLNNKIVGQFLSILDGVLTMNNILLIVMTNRFESLDPALLRSGRIENHIKINLPDENGRKEILSIHLKKYQENKMIHENVNIPDIVNNTRNFSGAEIENVVRNALNYALCESETPLIQHYHFVKSYQSVNPVFGCDKLIYEFSSFELNEKLKNILNIDESLNICISGKTGKTQSAIELSKQLKADYIKYISGLSFIGKSDQQKISLLSNLFLDASKVKTSCIILDNIESIIGYSKFDNSVYISHAMIQSLTILMTDHVTFRNKMTVICTSKIENFFEMCNFNSDKFIFVKL